jgi:iron(III) transport system permease protein
VLWHVTLRRARPAVAVAALWAALIASAEISVTDFFQVRTFAEEVYTQAALGATIFGQGSSSAANMAAWWLGLLLATLLAAAAVIVIRPMLVDLGNVSLGPVWKCRPARGRLPMAVILATIMLFVAGVPLFNLLYKAGGTVVQTDLGRMRGWSPMLAWSRIAHAPQEFSDDLWLSTWVGAAAATGGVLFGLPLAWSLRTARRAPTLRVLALALCFTVPGPVLGIAVIHLLNRPPGSPLAFLSPLYDSQFPTWLVQLIRGLPIVTLVLWAAFASIPQALLEGAILDGIGWRRTLQQVALPLRWPAAGVAWLVGFAIAAGELSATVLVLPPGRSTAITVRVFQLLHYGADERVAAISIAMGIGASAIALLAAWLIWRQRR